MNLMTKAPAVYPVSDYECAWSAFIQRHSELLDETLTARQIHSNQYLNFLAAAWAKAGLELQRDSEGKLVPGYAYNPLYTTYVSGLIDYISLHDSLVGRSGLGDGYRADEPETLTRQVLARLPHATTEVDIVQRIGRNLKGILQSKVAFMEAVSPSNDVGALEALYFGSYSAILQNFLFSGVFRSVASVLDHPLKVLEIGAGTGGATASIDYLIRKYCREYWFTDVSNVFLNGAKRRFKEDIFKYSILDAADSNSFEQLAGECFDLVIASNALHTVSVLPEALKNINMVLREGGCLLLTELDKPSFWTEFIFGAAPDWWNGVDDPCRTTGPLAAPETWLNMSREVIGPSFASISSEFIPDVEEDFLRELPQTMVAVKGRAQGCGISGCLSDVASVVKDEVSQQGISRIRVQPINEVSDISKTLEDCDLFAFTVEIDLQNIDAAVRMLDDYPPGSVEWCLFLAHPPVTADMTKDQQEALLRKWFSVLVYLREMAARNHVATLFTYGAFELALSNPNLSLSVYRGIFATFFGEYPNASMRTFDLDTTASPAALLKTIESLLDRPLRQEELVERRGKVFIRSLAQTSFIRPKESVLDLFPRNNAFSTDPARIPAYRIELGSANDFDELDYVAFTDTKLAPEEVRVDIHYASLNYRDVMKVLGEYPFDGGDYMNIGDECTGIVVAIGEKVDPGLLNARVMIMGEQLLASQAIVHWEQLVRLPDGMLLSEGATIPVAYLTAHYALAQVARLKAGERVLIHSAAGGVGLAAIKVAKSLGAIVYATASQAKQNLVKNWGADYIFDSRSLDFERHVLRETQGHGVDVILNSLSGSYQTSSVRLLASSGRFVELGKRDIYESRAINQYKLRKNTSFHVVDLSRVFREDYLIWKRLFSEIMTCIAEGCYLPIPYRVYRASHVSHAFRTMATGRHTGKILISMRDPDVRPRPSLVHRFKGFGAISLLITGGVSGFGFEIARYMTLCGAAHVILVSRANPNDDRVTSALEQLRKIGTPTTVAYVQCDVTNRQEVEAAVEALAQRAHGRLGIVHAAGMYDDRPIPNIDWESFRKVCMPKVLGAINLHYATQDYDPDIFCMVSSVSATLGSQGQCSYSAANAFLDGLAVYRHMLGLAGTSINFGPFEDLGFLVDKTNVKNIIARQGARFVPKLYAFKAMENAVVMGIPQISVFDMDWGQWRAQMRFNEVPDKLKSIVSLSAGAASDSDSQKIDVLHELTLAEPSAQFSILSRHLCDLLADILNTDASLIDTHSDLASQGLDSLSTMELLQAIERSMPLNLSPEEFAETRTVKAMANLLLRKYEKNAETTA